MNWIFFLLSTFAAIFLGLVLLSRFFSRLVRRKMPATGEHLLVNGSKVHFHTFGKLDPDRAIVMIHGLNGSAANFTYALTKELGDSVVVLDRPGSGYSERALDREATLPAQADLIANFIKQKELNHPFIVGHSLGGAIALQLALDYPTLISGAALISPLTTADDDLPPVFKALNIRSAFWRRVFSLTLATPFSILYGKRKGAEIFSPTKTPYDFAFRGGGLVGIDHRSFYGASTDFIHLEGHLETLSQRYSSLRVPISVLYGREDNILHHEKHIGALKTSYPAASTELMEGGHMIPATHPKEVAAFILAARVRAQS